MFEDDSVFTAFQHIRTIIPETDGSFWAYDIGHQRLFRFAIGDGALHLST
jgi:hypothetical protein